jgi:hypothetical protein
MANIRVLQSDASSDNGENSVVGQNSCRRLRINQLGYFIVKEVYYLVHISFIDVSYAA